jgi:ATP-dependent DNA helicase RecQ
MSPEEILKKYYGYDNFRPLQRDIIEAILNKKDTLALLPTGGGKSICFQVPALMQDGICLVISPLIALIKDQVENLKKRGINALAIYSGMHFMEVKQTLENAAHGNYKFLYISPERLETKLFLEYLPAIKPNLIAVDEAHCISQWGYDFRPAYNRIANLRAELPNVPIIALTASATPIVQEDICKNLLFEKGFAKFQQSFVRPNLSYSIFQPASKENKVIEIFKNVNGSGIVYCKSRKQTTVVAELLKLHGIDADFYHAGLSAEVRSEKQNAWINNSIRIIVCTNAFGMGIDKPDVRVVVHYEVPDCLENYYQEAGRAGRDEKRAYAVMLQSAKEVDNLLVQLETKYPTTEILKNSYHAVMNYLQIAAGTGEGVSYDMDIATFAHNFQLNILQATYAIQSLAQEGFWSFTDNLFRQSTIVFLSNKSDLEDIQKTYPTLDPIIKGLLRSYEGIFDYPCTIYETLLSKFLKMPIQKVRDGLVQLHTIGAIDYKPTSDKPQLYLLQNRFFKDDLRLDYKNIALRKEEAKKRVMGITNYAKNELLCRSKIIADYFGDKKTKDCGVCDNCLNSIALNISTAEFKNVSDKILALLQYQSLSSTELIAKIKPTAKAITSKVVAYLLNEMLIETDENNCFTLKDKKKGPR